MDIAFLHSRHLHEMNRISSLQFVIMMHKLVWFETGCEIVTGGWLQQEVRTGIPSKKDSVET